MARPRLSTTQLYPLGKIVSANKDARFKVKDVSKISFFIYYEVDGDNSKHSLQLGAYGKDQDSAYDKTQETGCSLHQLRDTVCSSPSRFLR